MAAEEATRIPGWQSLFESLPHGMLVVAPDGLIFEANAAAAAIVGVPRERMRGSRFEELRDRVLDQDGRALVFSESAVAIAVSNGDVLARSVLGVVSDEFATNWLSCSVQPLEEGGSVVTLDDITERRNAEASLRESESRLRAIFESEPECVKIVSSDGILLDMNPAGLRMLEVDARDEAIGRPVDRMVVPECKANFHEIARRALGGETARGEFEIVGKKGTRRWMETSAVPLPDADGQIRSLLAVTRDVTEGRRAEVALRENEAKLRSLYELSPLGIALTRMDGRYIEFNEAFRRITGYSDDELRKLDYWALTPEEFASKEAEQLDSLASIGRYGPYEKEYIHKDGHRVPIRLNGVLVSGNAGSKYIWSIVEDVTEQRRFEAERSYVEKQLERAQKLESLGSLAGGVAHDMNNVLAAILGLASVEREDAQPGSRFQESMDTIIRACVRGGTLVKGLLGFARADLAVEKLIDLNALVREEIALLERTTLQKVRLLAELSPEPMPVRGDPAALSHALMNLCVNAVDAMAEGGTLRITTRLEGASSVLLQVADDGCGMSREVLDRALDPFFTTKPQGKGTGLGLSIVYGAVKAHGGSLEINSSPGGGTTVTIRLQRVRPSKEDAPPERAAAAPHRELTVLVVDDDELVQSSVARVLKALGHRGELAGSGEDAIQLVRGGLRPDAVVLDINMPGMGGAAALPLIRQLLPTIPVILSTGRADQAALDLASGSDRVSLLAKPFTVQALGALLKEVG